MISSIRGGNFPPFPVGLFPPVHNMSHHAFGMVALHFAIWSISETLAVTSGDPLLLISFPINSVQDSRIFVMYIVLPSFMLAYFPSFISIVLSFSCWIIFRFYVPTISTNPNLSMNFEFYLQTFFTVFAVLIVNLSAISLVAVFFHQLHF